MANFKEWNDVKKHFKEPDIFKMLDIIFRDNEVKDQAIAFNHEQLQEGEDAEGKIIETIGGHPYSFTTIRIKQKEGKTKSPPDKVTLYDTGEFYDTFKVRLVKGGYDITAGFAKDDGSILDNFTGEFDFTGLQDSFLIELVMEDILPRLSQMIKEQYVI